MIAIPSDPADQLYFFVHASPLFTHKLRRSTDLPLSYTILLSSLPPRSTFISHRLPLPSALAIIVIRYRLGRVSLRVIAAPPALQS